MREESLGSLSLVFADPGACAGTDGFDGGRAFGRLAKRCELFAFAGGLHELYPVFTMECGDLLAWKHGERDAFEHNVDIVNGIG